MKKKAKYYYALFLDCLDVEVYLGGFSTSHKAYAQMKKEIVVSRIKWGVKHTEDVYWVSKLQIDNPEFMEVVANE